MAGFLINSRGTTLMVDPLLRDFDMPVLLDFPIATEMVPQLDAVLVTHSDNDHYSVPARRAVAPAGVGTTLTGADEYASVSALTWRRRDVHLVATNPQHPLTLVGSH